MVIAETYLILPNMILVLVLALDRIDPSRRRGAGLGAGPWGAFQRVTLPLSLPGVVVAGQLCLIWAPGAFVGPVLLGGPEQATLGVMVQKWGQEDSNWPRAAATAVLSLVTVAVCMALTLSQGAGFGCRENTVHEIIVRWLLHIGRGVALLALLAILAPFVYAVWMSFAPGELLEPPTR